MGLSSSTTKTKTTPVYAPQLEGAANSVTGAYNAAAPGIAQSASQIGGMVPGLLEKYTNGDPTVNAAQHYGQDVLSGKYLHGSPELDQIVSTTNNDTRNGLASSLGTRGLTGGSDFASIIANALAKNEGGLRYTDYNNQMGRMDQAAANAPQLAGASYLPLTAAISAAQSQMAPVQAAAGYGSSIGGLLGQYTNTVQKTDPGMGGLISSLLGTAASAFASGAFSGGGGSGKIGFGGK
jgi:hypothetical protein